MAEENHMGEEHNHDYWCRGHHGRDHMVIRWLLGIIILIAVFCLGVEVGKLHSMLRGGYGRGYGRMMTDGYFYKTMPGPLPQGGAVIQTPANNTNK